MFQLVHELVAVGSQGITMVGEFDGDSDLVLACACSLGWGRAQQRNKMAPVAPLQPSSLSQSIQFLHIHSWCFQASAPVLKLRICESVSE